MKGSSISRRRRRVSFGAPPSELNLLAVAITILATRSAVVLDLVALATLQLLGITRQVLTSGLHFVLSPATLAALQQLRAKSRFAAAHGTMYYDNGQHYMSHTTEERSAKQKAAFEEWMRSVENNTSVITVAELAALDPKRRGELEKMFGRDGVEAALLALAPGHVLWTDDFVFAEVAKSELGVERVWTQAMVEHLANRGLIDRALADEAPREASRIRLPMHALYGYGDGCRPTSFERLG
jgi:hypothetical protein